MHHPHSLLANIVNIVVVFQPEDVLKSLDERSRDIDSLIRPDGTKKFPAKTCYDLFLDYKSFKSGKCFLQKSLLPALDFLSLSCNCLNVKAFG